MQALAYTTIPLIAVLIGSVVAVLRRPGKPW